jgi:hypothetical protein
VPEVTVTSATGGSPYCARQLAGQHIRPFCQAFRGRQVGGRGDSHLCHRGSPYCARQLAGQHIRPLCQTFRGRQIGLARTLRLFDETLNLEHHPLLFL